VEQAKIQDGLSLEMELWDVFCGRRDRFSAICEGVHATSPVTKAGTCGCLVRFHGQYFPIERREAKICFEFPTIANGCKEHQVYEYVGACAVR
jgi:hypothetical protein